MKTFREILQIILLLAILLPATLYFMIQMPEVQTFLANKITQAISEKTQTKVSLKSVNYKFFKSLSIEDFFVEDTQGDTLIFVGRINATLDNIWVSGKEINLSSLELANGQFQLITENGSSNIDKFLERLQSGNKEEEQDKAQGESFSLFTKSLELENFKFTLQDRDDSTITHPDQINFADLKAHNINLRANNISLSSDTLFFNIEHLSLREKSGFHLESLTTDKKSYVCSTRAFLPGLFIIAGDSSLKFNYYAMNFPNGPNDLGDFLNKVKLEGDFDRVFVSFRTIGSFAIDLQPNPLSLLIQGKIEGTISDLKSDELNIVTSNNAVIMSGAFTAKGLPDIDKTIFTAKELDLTSTVEDLNTTINQILGSKEDILGESFAPFEDITIEGEISGLYNNFKFDGEIISSLGNIKAKAAIDLSSHKNDFDISGSVALEKFNLGALLKVDEIRSLSLNTEIKGFQPKGEDVNIYIAGNISELKYSDQTFRNIDLAGTLDKKSFDGKIISHDSNINFDFIGNIDMNKTEITDYEVNCIATIVYADLYKLGIRTSDTISTFSGRWVASFKGKDLDFGGTAKLLNAKYIDSQGSVDVGNIQLWSKQSRETYQISLQSTYVDLTYNGNNGINDFITHAQTIIPQHIPHLSTRDEINKEAKYEIFVKTKKSGNIARLVSPDLFVAANSMARLKIENGKSNFHLISDLLHFDNKTFKGVKLDMGVDSASILNLSIVEMDADNLKFKNIQAANKIYDNTILSNITYDNKTELANNGNINIASKILRDADSALNLKFKINPSQLVINSNQWDLTSDSAQIKGDYIEINKFNATSQNQLVSLDGIYAPNNAKGLNVELSNVDASLFNVFTEDQGFKIKGELSGKAQIINSQGKPIFFANITSKEITANDWLIGKLYVLSQWKDDTGKLDITVKITKDDIDKLTVLGSYVPKQNYIDLNINANNFEIKSIQPLIGPELSNLEGELSGKLNLSGENGNLDLLGTAKLNNAELTISFLQARYKFSCPIRFENNKIVIDKTTISDIENNKGTLSAIIQHKKLRDIGINIDLTAQNLIVLNTEEKHNEQFYGKVYATGPMKMSGSFDDLKFDVNVLPEKESKIYIPVDAVSISDNSPLSFVTHDSVKNKDDLEAVFRELTKKKTTEANAEIESRLNISLNIAMNKNAEVTIFLNRQNGDAIVGRGKGNLRMEINPTEEKFHLFGNYTIEQGEYTLIIPIPPLNLISKTFTINDGGRIFFNGNMEETKVDITADYTRVMRLSLRNLLSDTTVSNTKYPVICGIRLSENLVNPIMKPRIEIQNVDIDTKARAQSMLNTEEKMLKQFLSLLVLGNFSPEQKMGNTGGATGLSSNISEIFSNQLNGWLESIKLPVDVSVDVRTGASAETEFDANISLKLFDDRLRVSGNVGSAPRTSTSDIAGDFDIDIKLDQKGKLNAKVFSHSTDEYKDGTETGRQGIRISYQGGFNTWGELWRSIVGKKDKEKTKEKEENKTTNIQRRNKKQKKQKKANETPPKQAKQKIKINPQN